MSEYDELRRLHRLATGGRWVRGSEHRHGGSDMDIVAPSPEGMGLARAVVRDVGQHGDVDYIIALRNAAPGLIAKAELAGRLAVAFEEATLNKAKGPWPDTVARWKALLAECRAAGLLPPGDDDAGDVVGRTPVHPHLHPTTGERVWTRGSEGDGETDGALLPTAPAECPVCWWTGLVDDAWTPEGARCPSCSEPISVDVHVEREG